VTFRESRSTATDGSDIPIYRCLGSYGCRVYMDVNICRCGYGYGYGYGYGHAHHRIACAFITI